MTTTQTPTRLTFEEQAKIRAANRIINLFSGIRRMDVNVGLAYDTAEALCIEGLIV